MKEEDIHVGCKFECKTRQRIRSIYRDTFEVRPGTMIRVVSINMSPYPIVCRCQVAVGTMDSTWTRGTIVQLCNEGSWKLLSSDVTPTHSTNKKRGVNATNETCYFCGEPTVALLGTFMGAARYCPKCQK